MSIIIKRQHEILDSRKVQIERNMKAVEGGRPYIDLRLWRAPNETDTSWTGEPERGIVGRKERTALVNDAGRVANKINQYIFKDVAARKGADEAFLKNCSGDGETVHDFMQRVNLSITAGRWCWLQVDRAPLAEGEEETLANKAKLKWVLWNALDVPDWCVDDGGNIKWLITRSHVYTNDDPQTPAKSGNLYTLYELRDDGHVYVTEETDGSLDLKDLRREAVITGLKRIPFVLIGKPCEKGWWFDDVENLQAQVLNLDSQHNETLVSSVFPQIVLPSSVMNSLEVRLTEKNIDGKKVVALIRELTLGRKIPILEGAEDKGIARYIAPNGDMKLLTDEGTRKRNLLFDIAGLALFNKESRMVQTAESKQFDQLDTNSTLKNRAIMLQGAEEKVVALSKDFDPSFKTWEAQYPADFDVVDVAALSDTLVKLDNLPSAKKLPVICRFILKGTLRVVKEVASGLISDDDFNAAMDAVDAMPDEEFKRQTVLPDPFGGMGGDDDDDDEGDDDDKKPPVPPKNQDKPNPQDKPKE